MQPRRSARRRRWTRDRRRAAWRVAADPDAARVAAPSPRRSHPQHPRDRDDETGRSGWSRGPNRRAASVTSGARARSEASRAAPAVSADRFIAERRPFARGSDRDVPLQIRAALDAGRARAIAPTRDRAASTAKPRKPRERRSATRIDKDPRQRIAAGPAVKRAPPRLPRSARPALRLPPRHSDSRVRRRLRTCRWHPRRFPRPRRVSRRQRPRRARLSQPLRRRRCRHRTCVPQPRAPRQRFRPRRRSRSRAR